MTRSEMSKHSAAEPEKLRRRMAKSLLALGIVMIAVVVAWTIADRLGMFTYPDARTSSRPRDYHYTRAYNVRRRRNVNSGVNLTGNLQAPHEGSGGLVVEEKDFDAIHDAGFYHIRITAQLVPHLFMSGDTYELDQSYLTRLDWAIDNILQRDMIAILDFQDLLPDETYAFASEQDEIQCEQKFLAVWEILSERYKNYPSGLYFELMNEPHIPITPDMWNEYVRKALPLIRRSGGNNTTRMVIVGTNILIDEATHTWDQVNGIRQLQIPPVEEDPNIMVTFHYYEPTTFTFQGETFSPILARVSDDWMGNMWDNTDKQRELVERDFDVISQWAQEHQRKVVLGEFGVSIHADTDSQANWTTLIREEAESRGMIWILWQLYDVGTIGAIYNQPYGYWREETLNALLPDEGLGEGEQQESTDTAPTIQELIASLKDPEWRIRKSAAVSLTARGPESEPAVPALIEALGDEEWQVRESAAQALTAHALAATGAASQAEIPALIKALGDEEWQVRESAAEALGAIGTDSRPAIPALIEALSDEEWQVRESVMLALAAIAPEDPDVLAALQSSLDDPEDHVRRAAAEALKMIDVIHRPSGNTASPVLTTVVVCGVVLIASSTAWLVRSQLQRRTGREQS